MENIDKKIAIIVHDLELGEINEAKKLSLLDEISDTFTQRIILRLVREVAEDKQEAFIEKINNNKNDPAKILLFIDHFVDNADTIIDDELSSYRMDLQNIIQK